MPAKDGTGPTGQGSRTGGGRGNCPPDQLKGSQMQSPQENRPNRMGGFWNSTFGRLFRRRRGNRFNRR